MDEKLPQLWHEKQNAKPIHNNYGDDDDEEVTKRSENMNDTKANPAHTLQFLVIKTRPIGIQPKNGGYQTQTYHIVELPSNKNNPKHSPIMAK